MAPWTEDENRIILELAKEYVDKEEKPKWREIAKHLPNRNEHRVREHWVNSLDPSLNHGPVSSEEVEILLKFEGKAIKKGQCPAIARMLSRPTTKTKTLLRAIQSALDVEGYLDENKQFVIEDDTVIAAAVKAVMPAVEKYNNHGRAKGRMTGKNTEPRPSLASLDVNKLLAKNALEIEEKKERKRKKNEYTHTNFEELEEKLRGKRISHERESKLADESCEEEWVKDHRATENWLLENGFTKEELKFLVDYYKNLLDKGTMVPRRYHEKYI